MRNSTLAFAVLLAYGASSRPSNSVAQTARERDNTSGSICVLPNSSEPPTRISPGGEYNPDTLMVRVDKREPIRWPHNKPLLVQNLGMEDNHLVVLTSDGKQIRSFRFKFSDYHDAKLCVYFDGYQGVQLGNRRDALWCKVKNRDCWYVAQGIVGDVPGGLPPDGTSAIGGILSSEPRLPGVASPTHIRVAQGVMRSFLITKVDPSYPPEAERQRVDGTVVLRVNIDKNGNVSKVEPVTGHPLLIPAAVDAVRQWKYKPYLLNQTPVEIETTVLIRFVISGGNVYSVIAFESPNPHSWRNIAITLKTPSKRCYGLGYD